MSTHDPTKLPPDLPRPEDDGACDHLAGLGVASVTLASTSGKSVNLRALTESPTVLFFYPRTGVPGQPPPPGPNGEDWDSIPGARGCTPQSCGFRDLHGEFLSAGVRVFGVSTNSTRHQLEFKTRMHVPFELMSDETLRLTRAMRLPTFTFAVPGGGPPTLLKRMAWYCDRSRIHKVWYPVFPPDQNASEVLDWVRGARRTGASPRNSS
jgi:peroxiredoxin